MAQFLLDTFTDTAGANITSHVGELGATWTEHPTYTGATTLITNSNRARPDNNNATIVYASGSPESANYEIVVTVFFTTVVASDHVGCAGRINTSANTFYYAYWTNGSFVLRKNVAGAGTTLGTAAQLVNAGETWLIKLRMRGSTITLMAKGPADAVFAEKISVSDTSIAAAGKAGIYFGINARTNSTGSHIDAITADDILTPAQLSLVSADDVQIELSWIDPGSGTPPYTFDVHRNVSSGFTPNSANRIDADVTSPYVDDDPGLDLNVLYFYKVVSTDSAEPPGILNSNQQAASLRSSTVTIGFIGDSITDGSGVASKPGALATAQMTYLKGLKNATSSTHAIGGSRTSDWVSGSEYLANAKSQFATAGVTIVHIMLGTNDAKDTAAISDVTYLSNLTSTVNDLIGAGYTVVLCDPPAFKCDVTVGFSEAALERLGSYLPPIDSLINGTTIRRGARPFVYFAEQTALLASDGVHMSAAGNAVLAEMWAEALGSVLNTSVSGSIGIPRSRLVNAGG